MCFVSYRSRPKASSCSGSGTSKEAFSDKEAAGQGRRQRRCRQPQAPPRGRQKDNTIEPTVTGAMLLGSTKTFKNVKCGYVIKSSMKEEEINTSRGNKDDSVSH
nr:uncharacterized protein LOC109755708 [Aegilops tauschii subsp. strangulata]